MSKKNKNLTIVSELILLEKQGKYSEALERIKTLSNDEMGGEKNKDLNLKLLEQRLNARLRRNNSDRDARCIGPNRTEMDHDQTESTVWSAIITLWKRRDYLAEQLVAIRSQTLPPIEIIIIINEDHISEAEVREISGSDVKIIRSDINSLYSRWAVAYLAKGEYVSVFDDDVIPGKLWIANAIRACSAYNALVGPAGRVYSKVGIHGYYKLVVPSADGPNQISCSDTDVYCDWVCNSYLFKREWVAYALASLRYQDSFKTFDDIQLATSLYLSGGIRCVTPMQPSFDTQLHGSLRQEYGNDHYAIWKTNSDQHFAGRKGYIEKLIEGGYEPVTTRDNLHRFHLIVPFGERHTLERCLLTIKGQDYRNFTCTLIDDCCDAADSLDLIKQLGLEELSIRYIKTTKKAYPLRAREIATDMLGASPADVIVHLDGDDWLSFPDVLSTLNSIYRQGGVLATYGNAINSKKREHTSFADFSPYEMSRRWSVSQLTPDAEVTAFRKLREVDLANGWKDAPWCGMHLRTFKYSKWIGHPRKSFLDKSGEYLRVGTDAAIFVPILESCPTDSIVFVPDILYVYQNGRNTIHRKNIITAADKLVALSVVNNAQTSIDHHRIRRALVCFPRETNSSDAKIEFESLKYSAHTQFRREPSVGWNKIRCSSGAVTIITPNFLADAILCLMSYQRNLATECHLFVFIATVSEADIAACTKLLDGSGITPIFPSTLKYLRYESNDLGGRYNIKSDEYRWAMKAVVLMELLKRGYSLALFLDPDTYTVSDITDVHQTLSRNPISVFPHFRDPDNEYLRSVLYRDGFFNGGMLAATSSGLPHLRRLHERCLKELKKDPSRHRWDDQKYFDLFALEVANLHVNLDRGIDYNPWNYEPVEGLIAPSQRSFLLKSGYFVRHWHMSTMLIKNSIELKENKFSVYRPVVAIYLLSLLHLTVFIVLGSKLKLAALRGESLGLESRFNSIKEKLFQLCPTVVDLDFEVVFEKVVHSNSREYDQFLRKSVELILNSICFDNNEIFARVIMGMFPGSQEAARLASELRVADLRYSSESGLISRDDARGDASNKIQSVDVGTLVTRRLNLLRAYKDCF